MGNVDGSEAGLLLRIFGAQAGTAAVGERQGEASGGISWSWELQSWRCSCTRGICDGGDDRAGLHLRFMMVVEGGVGGVARVMVVSLEDGPWKHG